MNNNTNNNQNNMETQNPQVNTNNQAVPVQPTPQVPPVQQPEMQTNEVKESVVVDMDDDDDTPSGDASDITFDYNEIYGVKDTNQTEETTVDENLPVFDEKEIVIDENKLKKDTDDIVPEFRIDELEGNNTAATIEDKNLDTLRDDKDADKADTRRKIAYILVIALILIVFVWFIFPIMAGYKF